MKTFLLRNIAFITLISLTLFLVKCDSPVENIPAAIEIIEGPSEGQVLPYNNVLFSWRGNDPSFQFRTRLIGINISDSTEFEYLPWNDFSGSASRSFRSLSEGKYRFEIEGRIGKFIVSKNVTFTVDAIQNPYVTLRKRNIYVNNGDEFTADLYVENMDSLAAFEFYLVADGLDYLSIEKGDRVEDEGLEQYFSTVQYGSYSRYLFKSVITASPTSLPTRFISGDGSVAKLKFKAVSGGTFSLSLYDVAFVNINANLIDITVNNTISVIVSP